MKQQNTLQKAFISLMVLVLLVLSTGFQITQEQCGSDSSCTASCCSTHKGDACMPNKVTSIRFNFSGISSQVEISIQKLDIKSLFSGFLQVDVLRKLNHVFVSQKHLSDTLKFSFTQTLREKLSRFHFFRL